MTRADEVTVRVDDAGSDAVTFGIHIAGRAREVRFAGPGVSAMAGGDAAAAVALLPAMSTGTGLRIDAPVSPRLRENLTEIQEIVRSFAQRYPVYGRYRRVDVGTGTTASVVAAPGRGVACLFTAGVDSFYSVLRHRDEIDTLIYVTGFDVLPGRADVQAIALDGIRKAASALGKPLLVVDTDLRLFSDAFADWEAYHGAAFAAVAHLLAGRIRRLLIPATLTYAYLEPLGSHPVLDPLWGSDHVEIVHDGAHASRLDKLASIVDHPIVQRGLRVCWMNPNGAYNCGRCEKCLRTMVALAALGRAGAITSLPRTVDPRALASIVLPDVRYTWEASLAMLEDTGRDPSLARLLRSRLHGRVSRVRDRARYYFRRLRSRVASS